MLSNTVQLYRDSFKGLNSSVWLLSFINLINRSGTMVVPFMSMYITQDLGLSLTKAGFVLTCFGVGAIFGALAGGKLTDRIGHYKVQMLTLIFGGISFVILGQLKEFNSICIMTFVLALVNEAFRPANMSAIGIYSTPENRTRSSSLVRLSVNIGWAVGATLGGMLASINYELLFWVDGITNILAAITLYFTLRPSKILVSKKRDDTISPESVYKDHTFLYFVVLSFFFALCFFQLFSTYPVYLKKVLLLSERQIGWLFALNGILIAVFEMVIIHTLSKKNQMLRYISIGLFFTGISFATLLLTDFNFILIAILSCVLVTTGEIFSMPFMMSFWMNRSNDNNRGQYASLYTISYSAAHILGPVLGGMVADNLGFGILWTSILIFCIFVGLAFKKLESVS